MESDLISSPAAAFAPEASARPSPGAPEEVGAQGRPGDEPFAGTGEAVGLSSLVEESLPNASADDGAEDATMEEANSDPADGNVEGCLPGDEICSTAPVNGPGDRVGLRVYTRGRGTVANGCLRRSPRMTGGLPLPSPVMPPGKVGRTPSPYRNGCLRHSPRFVGASTFSPVTQNSGKVARMTSFQNGCLRGSPRAAGHSRSPSLLQMGNSAEKGPLAKVARMEVALQNDCLRRSPRSTTGSCDASEVCNGNREPKMTVMRMLAACQGGWLRRSPRNNGVSSCGPGMEEADSSAELSFLPIQRMAQSDSGRKRKRDVLQNQEKDVKVTDPDCFFVGDPILEEEAKMKWPHHYLPKDKLRSKRGNNSMDEDNTYVDGVKCHYYQANIVGCVFNLGDCAYIKGEEGQPNYIGRILEFFETFEGKYYFTVQWFYRAEDTVLKGHADFHDKKRIFCSDLKNDNPLDCIVSKVEVLQLFSSAALKPNSIPPCDYYCDMKYCLDYSTFHTMPVESSDEIGIANAFTCHGKVQDRIESGHFGNIFHNHASVQSQVTLLDLYSGCGGMSTGLCFGGRYAGLDILTKWAVDFNEAACQSLKLNHPKTQVRNESGSDFLDLLKEWEKLCKRYLMGDKRKSTRSHSHHSDSQSSDSKLNSHDKSHGGEFEVLKLVDICYGDPAETGKRGLKFKVRWKGYGPSEDTWEPVENLRSCQDALLDFVRHGYTSGILPLPGDVDIICGGPPCQGISGLNRHRNVEAPLDDEKNKQIVVFMDIVQFLKPKYVLMENVVDILRFANGTLGRYALSRLVHMKYQARVGIMAAGTYGVPQFRLRAFFFGAHSSKMLPQFPLPSHDVVIKGGGAPSEFERNLVAYNEDQPRNLEKALVLEDALSDLPAVTAHETRDQMPYGGSPKTEFQKYIRSFNTDLFGSSKKNQGSILYDHRPLCLGEDNLARTCQIPRKKGACFRDLPGVIVMPDNRVQRDPTMEKVTLPSGRLLVPDYCFTFEDGKSTRPFGRIWWDETVPTVFTSAVPHFQVILHPEQDRVLTIRENARLQGFPDCYRFCGSVKERYRQVGNAVAISVGRALGYAIAVAWSKKPSRKDEPLLVLPPKFSSSHQPPLQSLNPLTDKDR